MTILVRNHTVYRKSVFRNEGDFEAVCLQQLPHCLPEFRVIAFKPLIKGTSGVRRRPDLALVHKSLRMWFIVEVELSAHSLTSHVYPQMEAIATGAIEDEHVEYLVREMPDADHLHLLRMIRFCPPGVVVVADSSRVIERGWTTLRDELGVELSFLEAYRSPSDDVIFRLHGFRPEMTPQRLASGKYSPFLNALELRPSDQLPISARGELLIEFESAITPWQTALAADHAIAFPPADVILTGDRNYELQLTELGNLRLLVL